MAKKKKKKRATKKQPTMKKYSLSRPKQRKLAQMALKPLLRLRETKGWSVSELARECGVSHNTARGWITKKFLPSNKTLSKIVAVLSTHHVVFPVQLREQRKKITPRPKRLIGSSSNQRSARRFSVDVYASASYTAEEIQKHIADALGESADVSVRVSIGDHPPIENSDQAGSKLGVAFREMIREEVRAALKTIRIQADI